MRMPAWVDTLLGRFATLIERLVAVGFITTGVVLAAQTFLALFPLLIAITAFLPAGAAESVQETLRNRIGLSGSTDETVQRLVGNRDQLRGGISLVGAVVVIASATSFTRALQRTYEAAWDLPRMGIRGSVRGLLWLVGLVVYLLLLGIAIRFAGTGTPGTTLRVILAIVGSVLLWWWTPYLLLLGRVRARALLPGGLLTASAMVVLGLVGQVVVPRTVRNNERQYGTIGVVFAIESWLVVITCTIVSCAVVAAVAAQTDGPLGRIVRGTADPDGWRRPDKSTVDTG
jgi:membrane protein